MWFLQETDWQEFLLKFPSKEPWAYIGENTSPGTWQLQAPGTAPKDLNANEFLPVDDGALKNLALLLAPNRISMSMLYMLLAEARRAVPHGGLLVLVTKDAPISLSEKIRQFWGQTIRGDAPGLHPKHYISPEHWQLLHEERIVSRGVVLGRAAFCRSSFT